MNRSILPRPLAHRVAVPKTQSSSRTPQLRFTDDRKIVASPRERAQLLGAIRKLLSAAAPCIGSAPLHSASLECLRGGRSGTQVLKLTPFFDRRKAVKGPPLVIKLAPRRLGLTERSNYERHVRWGIPAGCRPELLAFADSDTIAAQCYSFLGNPRSGKADTLTAHLQRGNLSAMDAVLGEFIPALGDTWYHSSGWRSEADIAGRYLERYFPLEDAAERSARALQACAARHFHATTRGGRISIGRRDFPQPHMQRLCAGGKRRYTSCIQHGDLNSDNIVITGGQPGVAVLDFQKTGRGHVLDDLLHLEASIRINYRPDGSCADVLEKERLISLGRPPRNDPYCTAIAGIRKQARLRFGPAESVAHLDFAVAAIGLRLMLATDLSDLARARIAASVLWSARRMEQN